MSYLSFYSLLSHQLRVNSFTKSNPISLSISEFSEHFLQFFIFHFWIPSRSQKSESSHLLVLRFWKFKLNHSIEQILDIKKIVKCIFWLSLSLSEHFSEHYFPEERHTYPIDIDTLCPISLVCNVNPFNDPLKSIKQSYKFDFPLTINQM